MATVVATVSAQQSKYGIRINGPSFSEFDHLNSGYITASQFRRALDKLSIRLDDAQCDELAAAFDTRSDRSVNYRAFCNALAEYHDSVDRGPSSMADEAIYQGVLERTRSFATFRVDRVREWFADFDRHHLGEVTAAQFRRAFPFSLSDAEYQSLLRRFGATASGSVVVHYIAFDDAVHAAATVPAAAATYALAGTSPAAGAATPTGSRASSRASPSHAVSPAHLIARLQQECVTKGIRIDDAFVDFDRHRQGLLSRAQFTAALGASRFVLSPRELDALADAYANPDDGRIAYREFLSALYAAIVVEGLVTAPTKPAATAAYASPTSLRAGVGSDAAEAAVSALLGRLRAEVSRRRMLLLPFFEAHDTHRRGRLSQSRFHRVLAAMGLAVTEPDVALLVHRYADRSSSTYDICYGSFLEDIDPEGMFETSTLYATAQATLAKAAARPAPSAMRELRVAGLRGGEAAVDADALMGRIAAESAARGVRPRPLFADFDPLRRGRITAAQFRRALAALVNDALLSDTAVAALSGPFTTADGTVDYTAFVAALDATAVGRGAAAPRDVLLRDMCPARAQPIPGLSAAEVDLLRAVLARLAARVRNQGALILPVFRDFDRTNRGYITAGNFAQGLVALGLTHSAEELAVLVKWAADERGDVQYRMVVDAADPVPVPVQPGEAREVMLRAAAAGTGIGLASTIATAPYEAADVPLDSLIARIRERVATRRIRLSEFLRDSRFHTGRIPASRLGGAMAAAGIPLTASEAEALAAAFVDPTESDYIRHADLIAAIEGPLTARIVDAHPTAVPVEYHARAMHTGSPRGAAAERPAFGRAMDRMAGLVASRRMHLKPTFLDHDRHFSGKIAAAQFTSVLEAFFQLAQDELAAVVGAFTLENGLVDYAAYLRAVAA